MLPSLHDLPATYLFHSFLKPLTGCGEFSLFLRLRPLMFERGSVLSKIPRYLHDVLGNVRVDVPER